MLRRLFFFFFLAGGFKGTARTPLACFQRYLLKKGEAIDSQVGYNCFGGLCCDNKRAGSMRVFLHASAGKVPKWQKVYTRGRWMSRNDKLRLAGSSSVAPLASTVNRTLSKWNASAPQASERESTVLAQGKDHENRPRRPARGQAPGVQLHS